MSHDQKSAGGLAAPASAAKSGVNASSKPLRRRVIDGQRLSFVTHWETSTRRLVACDYFDVHAFKGSSGASGTVLGYMMARELFEGLHTDPSVGFYYLSHVMRAAYAVPKDPDVDPLRFDAAIAFISACNEFLRFAASACDHQRYLNRQIAQTEECLEARRQRKEERKRRFVEQMQRAKVAKRHSTMARQLVTEASHG